MKLTIEIDPRNPQERQAVIDLLAPSFTVSPSLPEEQTQGGEGRPNQPGDNGAEPKAMAKAKAMAEEAGIDWRELFPGSGKDGMVRQDDVKRAIRARQAAEEHPPGPGEPTTIEFSEVRRRLSEFVQKFDKEKAKELLQRYGVERVSALDAEHYPKFYAELGEALA